MSATQWNGTSHSQLNRLDRVDIIKSYITQPEVCRVLAFSLTGAIKCRAVFYFIFCVLVDAVHQRKFSKNYGTHMCCMMSTAQTIYSFVALSLHTHTHWWCSESNRSRRVAFTWSFRLFAIVSITCDRFLYSPSGKHPWHGQHKIHLANLASFYDHPFFGSRRQQHQSRISALRCWITRKMSHLHAPLFWHPFNPTRGLLSYILMAIMRAR